MAFFQDESKFVVGECYEFIRVKRNYRNPAHEQPSGESFNSWIKRSDEVGDVLPDRPVYLGKYVKSVRMGSGDGRTRYDYFNKSGEQVVNVLLYDGTTRYRKVSCLEPTQENKNRKSLTTRELKSLPGGTNYLRAQAEWPTGGKRSKRSSRRSSKRSSSSKRKTRKSRK